MAERFKAHKMIEGYTTGEDIDVDFLKELIAEGRLVDDLAMHIEDTKENKILTYRECVNLLNENEQLKKENEVLKSTEMEYEDALGRLEEENELLRISLKEEVDTVTKLGNECDNLKIKNQKLGLEIIRLEKIIKSGKDMTEKGLFLKTKNLVSLIWHLTNYPPYGDIPVYVQVQGKIYPIRSVDCLKNLNGDDNALVINISNITGGEIPKDCITCGNNVFGECYHYKPYKNVLNNQLHCDGEHWKPIKRGVKK